MNRTTFLIDGFNLYHSVRDAGKDLNGGSTKWLNVRALCDSYLHLIGNVAQTEEIYYFSALANHLTPEDPGKVRRHKDFIKCLKATGVRIELARFKRKQVPFHISNNRNDHCGGTLQRFEEKETDVAIAAKLFELLIDGDCDTAVLMTGDTDLAPAVKTARRVFPNKAIGFAFPYKRKNKELSKLTSLSFNIDKRHYAAHQLPDPFTLKNGGTVSKPPEW